VQREPIVPAITDPSLYHETLVRILTLRSWAFSMCPYRTTCVISQRAIAAVK